MPTIVPAAVRPLLALEERPPPPSLVAVLEDEPEVVVGALELPLPVTCAVPEGNVEDAGSPAYALALTEALQSTVNCTRDTLL